MFLKNKNFFSEEPEREENAEIECYSASLPPHESKLAERLRALCEAAGPEDDVLLPAWTVQTLTGKPTVYEDPTVWTNESMAHYFGVASVRAVPQEEMAVAP